MPGIDPRPSVGDVARVRVRVPAKVNLVLDVGALRPDGFHELTTVFQAVGLYDVVTAESAPGDEITLALTGEGEGLLPLDDGNLAVRAARALAAHVGREPGVRLRVEKSIPVAGGLAGGSADAAGTLVACDALWGTALAPEELAGIAATLGSDVPFALHGGTALGTGRGESLVEVLGRGTLWWVLAVADGGLSTPEVYARLDQQRDEAQQGLTVEPDRVHVDRMLAALRAGSPARVGEAIGNTLEDAALHLRPELAPLLQTLMNLGCLGSTVSGSGPTCMGLAADQAHAEDIARRLAATGTVRLALTARGPVPGARVVL